SQTEDACCEADLLELWAVPETVLAAHGAGARKPDRGRYDVNAGALAAETYLRPHPGNKSLPAGVGFVTVVFGRDRSTLLVVLWMDWRLTLVSLAVVPVLLAISWYFSAQIQAATRKKQLKESEVASIVQETMTSIAVVQAFTQEKRETRRLRKESEESLDAALESTRFSRAFGQLVKILSSCGTALVVWYGVSRVLGGKLTPGDIIVFVAYVK